MGRKADYYSVVGIGLSCVTFEYCIIGSRQPPYAISSFCPPAIVCHAREVATVLMEESRSHHVDLSEDSERDLFDGRGPSSSEDVALEEEEGVVVTWILP